MLFTIAITPDVMTEVAKSPLWEQLRFHEEITDLLLAHGYIVASQEDWQRFEALAASDELDQNARVMWREVIENARRKLVKAPSLSRLDHDNLPSALASWKRVKVALLPSEQIDTLCEITGHSAAESESLMLEEEGVELGRARAPFRTQSLRSLRRPSTSYVFQPPPPPSGGKSDEDRWKAHEKRVRDQRDDIADKHIRPFLRLCTNVVILDRYLCRDMLRGARSPDRSATVWLLGELDRALTTQRGDSRLQLSLVTGFEANPEAWTADNPGPDEVQSAFAAILNNVLQSAARTDVGRISNVKLHLFPFGLKLHDRHLRFGFSRQGPKLGAMYQFSAGIDRLDANTDERGAWTLTYLPDLGGGAFDLRKQEDDRGRQWAERRNTSYSWRWNGDSFVEQTSEARRRRHSR